jgi:hypothetical protein
MCEIKLNLSLVWMELGHLTDRERPVVGWGGGGWGFGFLDDGENCMRRRFVLCTEWYWGDQC